MEEKRYLYKLWDNAQNKSKIIFIFVMVALASCIVLVATLLYGDFSVLDYQEEDFQKLEQAYIPYVHEGIGIDLVGLKGAVHSLCDPIISDEAIELTYGYFDYNVTVTLDKNYKVMHIDRSANTEQEYVKQVITSNIGLFFFYTLLLLLMMFVILTVIYATSYCHALIDKKRSKNNN